MALVLDGYNATISIVDTGGNRSIKQFDLTATTFADALSDTQAIIALLDPLTTGVIERYSVNTVFNEDAFAWPAGSQVENIAEVVLLLADGINKTEEIQIPSPIINMFIATEGKGNNIVNTSYAPLVSFVEDVYQSGGYATISDGELAHPDTPIVSGRRVHRKSRKG